MNISDHGLQFIAGWEGKRNFLYDDLGPGKGNATIGVGHLVHLGPIDGSATEAPYRNGISDEQVYALFRVDAQKFVDIVNASIHVPINQNQFDALCDFAFNLGSLLGVAPAVNLHGDVCAELRKYIHAGAVVVPALIRRREAECTLYHTAVIAPPPVEEDEDMPFLVWAPQQQRTYLVGPKGAYWVMSQSLSNELTALFGPVKMAVSNDALNAIGVVS